MAEAGVPASHSQSGARRFLTFRLDGRLYALPAEEVIEVIPAPPVARVPQAPKALLGLANLRGTVLPLASLRVLLGLEEGAAVTRAIILDGSPPAALAVDLVEALVSVAAEQIETRQAELAAEPGETITGAFKVEGADLARILDVKSLLDRAFALRADRKVRGAATMAAAQTGQRDADSGTDTDLLVSFDVAGQEYALALSSVQAILPVPETPTAVPRTEALVVGVMAYRDTLLPLLSLRALLGFRAGASDGREKVVVASVGGVAVGLVADRARAIVAAERDLVEPIPAVLAARSGGEARIKAIYRGEEGRRLISILAPDQLFREDVMQRLGPRQETAVAETASPKAAERQFVVFRLGDDEFALPIEAVDEVARVPDKITRVPKTPKFLEGVVNLRGEVLPVVDQRRRFDMAIPENNERRRLVVVRTDRLRAGLIVDSVSEVLRTTADAIAPPPDLTGDITRLVKGVVNLPEENRIVLLLDPGELLTRVEQGLLDAFAARAAK